MAGLDGLADSHLLGLGHDGSPEDLLALASDRFSAAALLPGSDREPGRLRLSRHSELIGPYLVDAATRSAVGLPPTVHQAWCVRCPRERGARPWPGGGDRYGIARAFPDGLPVREEDRVVQWLVAAARRLGGVLVVAGSGATLSPEPESAVDLTVWSDRWVEPAALLTAVRRAAPSAHLSSDDAVEWQGPAVTADAVDIFRGAPVPGGQGIDEVLSRAGLADDALRAWVHAEADAYDAAMLAAPPSSDRFGVVADLGADGTLLVEAGPEEIRPPAAERAGATVAYLVHWEPLDPEENERERPSFDQKVARRRAAEVVRAAARSVQTLVGGVVVDEVELTTRV